MDESSSVARSVLEGLAGEALPEWPAVAATAKRLRVSPGTVVFRDGQAGAHVHFVGAGVAKLAYGTDDGREWIKGFAAEGSFFASLAALQPGGVAGFSAVAIEPLVLERLDYAVMAALAERHVAWHRTLLRAMQVYGARKERRERDLLLRSPQQRYRDFLAEHAGLEARIAQKDLAAYIRVTPVALSRIKARCRREDAGAIQS